MNEAPRDLLREAADWRLLSLLLECPSEAWREPVAALALEAGDDTLREAASATLAEAAEGVYHSIFGPGGPAPAREASYRGGFQLGYLLANLSAIYEAFGYRPITPEAPDHAAVETGFIAYLKFKQAYAESCGAAAEARMCEEAAERFTREHLRILAGPLAERLESGAPRYLVLAGRVLLERAGPPETAPAFGSPGLAGEADGDELMCDADAPAVDPLVQLTSPEAPHGSLRPGS
jgi:nitrate reductase assembly molybdenum cofactor insertion protein NarJ